MLSALRLRLIPHGAAAQSLAGLQQASSTRWTTNMVAARYLHVSGSSANSQTAQPQTTHRERRTAKQPRRRHHQKPAQQQRQPFFQQQDQVQSVPAELTPVVLSWSDKGQRSQLLLRRLHSLSDQPTTAAAFAPLNTSDEANSEAVQLLNALLGLAGGNHFTISQRDWSAILRTLQRQRLYDLALPFYAVLRHQHDVLIEQQRAKRTPGPTATTDSNAAPASSRPLAPMPAKCVAMLLECVVHSTCPAASVAAPLPTEVQAAVTALFNGRESPPSPSARGVELAAWLLRDMRSPNMLHQFIWNVSPWTVVLQGLAQQVEQAGSPHRREQIDRVRAFFDSIPVHSTATHDIMRGLADSAAARSQGAAANAAASTGSAANDSPEQKSQHEFQSDVGASGASLFSNSPSRSLKAMRGFFFGLAQKGDWKKAERMAAKAQKNGVRLDNAIINEWLGCYSRSGEWRGAERAWQRMAELGIAPDAVSYLKLMQVYMASGEAEQLAKIEPLYAEMTGGSGPAGAPLQFSVRDYDSLIKAAHSSRLVAEARQWAERARVAGLSEQLDETSRRILATVAQWEHQPRLTAQEEQRARLKNRLLALAPASDWVQAERLVADAEAVGTQIDVKIINAWLGCHTGSGEWRGAEKVWRRMIELGLVPTAYSYCNLLQVYMANGEADQLAKIEPLYAEMTSGSGPAGQPLQFSVRDFGHLIKTAHRCRLAAEARQWAEHVRAAGLWDQLDEASQRIVAFVDVWRHKPRAPLARFVDAESLHQR